MFYVLGLISFFITSMSFASVYKCNSDTSNLSVTILQYPSTTQMQVSVKDSQNQIRVLASFDKILNVQNKIAATFEAKINLMLENVGLENQIIEGSKLKNISTINLSVDLDNSKPAFYNKNLNGLLTILTTYGEAYFTNVTCVKF